MYTTDISYCVYVAFFLSFLEMSYAYTHPIPSYVGSFLKDDISHKGGGGGRPQKTMPDIMKRPTLKRGDRRDRKTCLVFKTRKKHIFLGKKV